MSLLCVDFLSPLRVDSPMRALRSVLNAVPHCIATLPGEVVH